MLFCTLIITVTALIYCKAVFFLWAHCSFLWLVLNPLFSNNFHLSISTVSEGIVQSCYCDSVWVALRSLSIGRIIHRPYRPTAGNQSMDVIVLCILIWILSHALLFPSLFLLLFLSSSPSFFMSDMIWIDCCWSLYKRHSLQ